MYKVVLDAFGGDNAPFEVVKGAVLAVNENINLKITLVGKENEIMNCLKELNYKGNKITIINADDVITNNHQPTVAIRKMPNSSLVKSLEELKTSNDYLGFVSAGSTGAVLTGAVLKLGRIKGVSRPTLCPLLPTVNGGVVAIADVGANVDSKPINLVHFAVLGSLYLENVLNVKNPRVALLNVGTEKEKGNDLTKQAYDLLNEVKEINFVGNMESRNLLSGDVDLVVCDGFSGNVLLKSTEGAVYSVLKMIKKEIISSLKSKIGYLFMKKSFDNLRKKLDYSNHGGAVFLGCKYLVVKAHGSSKAESIKNSIFQVVDMGKADLVNKIEKSLININLESLSEVNLD